MIAARRKKVAMLIFMESPETWSKDLAKPWDTRATNPSQTVAKDGSPALCAREAWPAAS